MHEHGQLSDKVPSDMLTYQNLEKLGFYGDADPAQAEMLRGQADAPASSSLQAQLKATI